MSTNSNIKRRRCQPDGSEEDDDSESFVSKRQPTTRSDPKKCHRSLCASSSFYNTKDASNIANNTNHINKLTSNNDTTILFDVGGYIFKVRKSLINSYPSTMLARSAAEIWNTATTNNSSTSTTHPNSNSNKNNIALNSNDNSTSTDVNSTNDTNRANQSREEQSTSPTGIYIDRDSHRFGYVLDYMRDGGYVELPVTISKDSFLNDLQYYGFDDICSESIKISVPTYESVLQLDACHERYKARKLYNSIEKEYIDLAYSCFQQFLQTKSLFCVFRTTTSTTNSHNNTSNNATDANEEPKNLCKIAQTLAREYNNTAAAATAATSTTSNSDTIVVKNVCMVERHYNESGRNSNDGSNETRAAKASIPTTTTATSNSSMPSRMNIFNKCLEDYGLQCTAVEYESGYAATIQLIPIEKSII